MRASCFARHLAIHPIDHLVGGLEHEFYFPYIGNNDPNWLIFVQRGWNHQPGIFRGWLTVMQCYARLLLAHRGLKKFDLCQSCKATDQLRRINPPYDKHPLEAQKMERFGMNNSGFLIINWLTDVRTWKVEPPNVLAHAPPVEVLDRCQLLSAAAVMLSPLGLKQSNPMVYQKSEARG